VVDEINLAAETVAEAEIGRAKAQMKAGLLMALESSGARAEQLARQMINWGRPIALDEIVAKIEAVSVESTRAAGRALIAQGEGGAILNVLATYAWTGGPGTVHSACAKAGLLAMTRTLAVEWARHGIRVNGLAPGPLATEGASARLWPSDALEERVRRAIPLGRFAELAEVADAALYLLSDHASYVTGEVLTLDGGGWLGRGILAGEGPEDGVPVVRRRRAPRG